jgi:DNA end-binding protein Ku
VAIGQLIMQGREHLVGITAHGKELLVEILRYPNELKDPARYFEKVTAVPKQGAVAMAAELIERQSGKLEPSKMPNEYAKTVKELVRAKVEHRMSEINLADDSCKAPKVINIMAALKESMQAKGREMVRDAVRKRMGQAAPERTPH